MRDYLPITILFQDLNSYTKLRAANTTGEMKSLGYAVKGFNSDEWARFAEEVANTFLPAKFSQNEQLKQYLLSTGSRSMIEAAPNDSLWGIGIYMYDSQLMHSKSKWGKNIIGESLMKVRQDLR